MASTGTEFEHVPYKGGASARDAVAKNELQLMDEVLAPLIGSIRVVICNRSSSRAMSVIRCFPMFRLPSRLAYPTWRSLVSSRCLRPRKTLLEIVQTLNAAMKEALGSLRVVRGTGRRWFRCGVQHAGRSRASLLEGA